MIRTRNIDPRTPSRSAVVRDTYVVLTMPTDADGFCTSQAINTGVETTLNLDGLFAVNKHTLDSGGSSVPVATAANLIYPSDLMFTLGAAVAVTGVVDGVDHLGNSVYFEFSKASSQTVFTLAQSTQVTITKNGDPARGIQARSPFCCYSAINLIKLTNAGANSTVTVGWTNTGGNSFRMPRIPLPVLVDGGNDFCDAVLLKSTGGATVTTPAAVPAQVNYSTIQFASGDVMNFGSGAIVESVAGTGPYEWVVSYRAKRNVNL